MLKRLILMVSVDMLVSSLAMTAYSADVRKIKPGDLRQAPKVVQTPEKIDTGHIQRPKPDLTITAMQLYPANPIVNDQIPVTATLKNIGDIPAGSFKIGVRIGGESQPRIMGSVGHLDVTTPPEPAVCGFPVVEHLTAREVRGGIFRGCRRRRQGT